MVTVEGFNDSASTLGDSLITGTVNLNINGMKFTTKWDFRRQYWVNAEFFCGWVDLYIILKHKFPHNFFQGHGPRWSKQQLRQGLERGLVVQRLFIFFFFLTKPTMTLTGTTSATMPTPPDTAQPRRGEATGNMSIITEVEQEGIPSRAGQRQSICFCPVSAQLCSIGPVCKVHQCGPGPVHYGLNSGN